MFDDALMKIQISNADTHSTRTHTQIFLMLLFLLSFGCECVLLWPVLYMYNNIYIALALTTTIKYSFTACIYWDTHVRIGCYTFLCICLIQFNSFILSLSFSLSFTHSPFTWCELSVSERANKIRMYLRACLCVCICELQIPVGIFSVEHISYTIQTAINGHRERSRYIKVSIL